MLATCISTCIAVAEMAEQIQDDAAKESECDSDVDTPNISHADI